jgi:hypothetical protein
VRSRSDVVAEDALGEVVTPPLSGRIHYLIGGTLRPESRAWVWQDLTSPGWRRRQALRPVWCMLPFAIGFAIAPGPASVRVSIPLGLLLIALVMGLVTGDTFRNKRLDRHGLPRPKVVEEDDWIGEDEPASGPRTPATVHPRVIEPDPLDDDE